MAFVALTDLETNAKKPVRQALMKKLKDNFDDHETRVLALQNEVRSFEHFNAGHAGSRSFPTMRASGSGLVEGVASDIGKGISWFMLGSDSFGVTNFKGNQIKPHHSVARMDTASSTPATQGFANSFMFAHSQRVVRFDQVIKPIVFQGRFKLNNTDKPVVIGFYFAQAYNSLIGNEDGVYLTRVDSTNWRFLTKFAGSTTNGALIARPTSSVWFEVKIELTDDPVDKILTSIDTGGGLTQIDDLQVDIPKTISLSGIFGARANLAGNFWFDCDRVLIKSGALSDAP